MLLTIDLESETPIYLQLRNQVLLGIARGELAPGRVLPSTRSLAQDLGVNMHTVAKAYGLLKSEGFVAVHRRKGVRIRDRESLLGLDPTPVVQDKLAPLAAQAVCAGMGRKAFLDLCRKVYEDVSREKQT